MGPSFEAIVVGLRAMGSATLYQLAARGMLALGLDPFALPLRSGSSRGDTRVTQLVVGEGDAYIPLVRRSHDIWRALEVASGEILLTLTGDFIIGPESGGSNFYAVDDFVRGGWFVRSQT